MMTRRDRTLTHLFPRRGSSVNTPPCSTPQTIKGALLKNSRMQNFALAVEKRYIVFFYIISKCMYYVYEQGNMKKEWCETSKEESYSYFYPSIYVHKYSSCHSGLIQVQRTVIFITCYMLYCHVSINLMVVIIPHSKI